MLQAYEGPYQLISAFRHFRSEFGQNGGIAASGGRRGISTHGNAGRQDSRELCCGCGNEKRPVRGRVTVAVVSTGM